MEITQTLVEEVPGFIQVCADGFIVRFDHKLMKASASADPIDGVRTRDVTIDSSRSLWARLFLPTIPNSQEKLPLILYFHGGGFCIGSTAWQSYHEFLSGLSIQSKSVVVSVDYRLAPENRLPAAYDDCFDALNWVFKSAQNEALKDSSGAQNEVLKDSSGAQDEIFKDSSGAQSEILKDSSGETFKDQWLANHVDFSRIFLAGESAGGNIAHTVGIMAARKTDLKIRGLIVLQPYFGSEERIECEKKAESEYSTDDSMALEFNDTFWRMALPEGANRDHPACNPQAPGAADLGEIALPPVLVTVAGLDLLKARGVMYYDLLKGAGKEAEFMEEQGETHVYFLYHPKSQAAVALQDRISQFVHRF